MSVSGICFRLWDNTTTVGNDGARPCAVVLKNLDCSRIELFDSVRLGEAIQIKHSEYFPLQAESLKQ